MSLLSAPLVVSRIEDLCRALAEDASLSSARQAAESFLADDHAVGLYRDMVGLGRQLQQRRQAGALVEESELNELRKLQEQAQAHPGINGFLAAQQSMQEAIDVVHAFVAKTLQGGKVPTAEEIAAETQGGGCCGGGGCGSGGCGDGGCGDGGCGDGGCGDSECCSH
jgi:cell fate (sporulation/competence/biofilm development) regulator YlbF (YheA/YmcA/DUF963 family)